MDVWESCISKRDLIGGGEEEEVRRGSSNERGQEIESIEL